MQEFKSDYFKGYKNSKGIGERFVESLGMKLKIKYKLFISVSDLAKAEESQKVISKLMKKYNDNKAPDADVIKATPFGISNGELKGINIVIRCISKDEANRYRIEFNMLYGKLTRKLESKPIKCVSLIDIGQFQILSQF